MTPINQFFSLLLTLSLCMPFGIAQTDQTGMPGDNFSLEGTLELFKKAKSPEHFEELLNKEDSQVNNLDLNDDGEIDYIRVIDHYEDDAHAITLQVELGKNDAQDIAVIAIEKNGNENATLQIIGDEEIYGEEVVVEPFEESGSSDGKGGPSAEYAVTRVVVNVWLWPSVRYIYRPAYRVYVSPWHWGYYPGWYRPWRPLSWAIYGPRVSTWRIGYRVTPTVRVTRARRIYTPRRTTSVTVVNRYKVNKTTYVSKRRGASVANKSKSTSVTKKTAVSQTKTTTAVKNGNRKAAVQTKSTKAVGTKGNKKVAGTKKTKTSKVKTNKGTKVKKKTTKTKKVKKKKK